MTFELPDFSFNEKENLPVEDELSAADFPTLEEMLELIEPEHLSPIQQIEDKLNKSKQLKEAQDILRREAEAALLKIQDERNKLRDEIAALERELAHEQMLEAERLEAERQKLLLVEEDERLKKLADELSQLCVDFPAYFQAHMYQHDGFIFAVEAYRSGKNGILNADDMGLGKTYQAIVLTYILSKLFEAETGRKPNVLWLTKKSLTTSTPREIQKWWTDAKVISSSIANDAKMREWILNIYEMTKSEFFLCNYEFVRTTPKIHKMVWDFVIIDEVHKLKGGANSNGPTKIWEACKSICHAARFNIFLSGTPMVNKPEEMWAYLHIFAPDRFPNLRQFERQFTTYRSVAGQYMMTVDADKILRSALKGQMIRRNAKEVGLQLPELTRQVIDLEMNPKQREIYDQIKQNMFLWLDEQKETPLTVAAMIALFTRFRQINTWPAGIKIKDLITQQDIHLNVEDSSKIDEVMDIIEESQERVVVFCTFNEPMFEVQRRCNKLDLICKVIYGETKNIGDYEQEFQNGEIDVLCVNSAMGEGLNLQKSVDWKGGARICVLMDLWWSPARNEQCIARVYRQGQTEPCIAYILHNENSIDNFILQKLIDKAASFETIMESKELRPASDWRKDLEGLL